MSDDGQDLLALFEQLGSKPKAQSPSELMQWMKDFVTHKEEQEEEAPAHTQAPFGSHSSPKQVLSHQVRLPNFSGDGKGDATFDLWRYEVKCLQREHRSADVIRQAIRRSLRGEAARIAMRLGPEASTEHLLEKFSSVYGEVEPQEVLLAKFYSARQQKDEDVSAWSCRLEDLLNKARPKRQECSENNQLLRVMFWSGLRDDLKDISGHLYESDKDYDQLRVAVRRIEQDHKVRHDTSTGSKKNTTPCKAGVTSTQDTDLHGMIQQLTTEMKTIREDQQRLHERLDSDYPHSMAQYGNFNNSTRQQQYSQRRDNPKGNRNWKKNTEPKEQSSNSQTDDKPPNERREDTAHQRKITCWNCGQEGHIAIGCRVRTDHKRRPLNFNRPASRGGQ